MGKSPITGTPSSHFGGQIGRATPYVGLVIGGVEIGAAAYTSYNTGDYAPVIQTTAANVTGWAGAAGGAWLIGKVAGLAGLTAGGWPAIITGGVGAIAGGVIGYNGGKAAVSALITRMGY